ncbi:unnamed protein product [Angiostrongylus costaricensis]|uniref:Trafficking protein particle complex subunit 8 n=1 Tax=Angiostrongylus costaricensis TaxID=334426 RepID=A0A0R3PGF0_ANGCS|nr:unnamed protein product [Angiostrongylus costaricensis]
MQSRRLADLAFMFGLFQFAYSQYRSVRKDFEHCQAWLHYAAASVRPLYTVLPDTSMYFTNSPHISVLLYHKYTSIMRCALNAASVLSSMTLFKEAASLISSIDIDMCVAVLQAHASNYFERANMTRKAAFYRILAGNRFMKAGLKQNALVCLPVPLVDAQETRVFYGERPQPDEVPVTSNISWLDMERAAFHALAGASSVFRPTHLVSDNETDNQRVRSTPPEERFRVEVSLRNPLKTPLTVQNVTLGITDVHMREGGEHQMPFTEREIVPSITIPPERSRKIMLWVRPSCHLSGFRVGSILLQIVGSNQASVSGFLPLKIKGKRLNTNPRQMKSVVYAVDERLRVSVAQKRWPLLDFNIVRKNQSEVYCGQAVVLSIDVCLLLLSFRLQYLVVFSKLIHVLLKLPHSKSDDVHGITAINMRNVMHSSDAALARCEVLRIRLVNQEMDSNGRWNEVGCTAVAIRPVTHGPGKILSFVCAAVHIIP